MANLDKFVKFVKAACLLVNTLSHNITRDNTASRVLCSRLRHRLYGCFAPIVVVKLYDRPSRKQTRRSNLDWVAVADWKIPMTRLTGEHWGFVD
jgi:hypothetical protein